MDNEQPLRYRLAKPPIPGQPDSEDGDWSDDEDNMPADKTREIY